MKAFEFIKPATLILDCDGTIADPDHRLHHIKEKHPKDWKAFHAETMKDDPHWDVIYLAAILHQAGWRVIVCTARQDSQARELTEKWLHEVAGIGHIVEKIYMRPDKDYREDCQVKLELLEQIRADGFDPQLVFEDRNRVVKAWRDAGIRCLQVQDGDY